jgi:hypothetical protein
MLEISKWLLVLRPSYWWPTLALSDGEILCAPHMTGSGRLLMAQKRLLLLRCEGHVVRHGWLR